MKIAFVLEVFPALSETFILNQITGLIDRGHDVDIYADVSRNEAKLHSAVEKYNLLDRTYYFQVPSNKLLRALKGLRLLLVNGLVGPVILISLWSVFKYGKQAVSLVYRSIMLLPKQPYDIIHCHFGPNGIKGAMLRDIGVFQGKLITTFHGYDVNRCHYPADYYNLLFHKGDLYTVNTTFTQNKAIALGCPAEKIIKLPVGVNVLEYQFRQRVLHFNEPIKIITVARLVEKKGIEYSIRATAKVAENHPNLLYRIIGDGPRRESLDKLIEELGLVDKVQLLGWKTQDEVRKLYADSHIFVLSSVTTSSGDQEGQGLVLQEAQAMGLPVLSTFHNGISDGVLDGKSGFLVSERDVDALAKKLSYLIEHPEVWTEMGQAGHAFVAEHYDINKLNDQLVVIYQQLLKFNM